MRVMETKPGDTLQVIAYEGHENGGSKGIIQTWTVIEIYPYHVLAVNGLERQCFTVGQLVQLGKEGHYMNIPQKETIYSGATNNLIERGT